MWSHELDDGSGSGERLWFRKCCLSQCEWASGIWDATHVLNANATVNTIRAYKAYLNQPGF